MILILFITSIISIDDSLSSFISSSFKDDFILELLELGRFNKSFEETVTKK